VALLELLGLLVQEMLLIRTLVSVSGIFKLYVVAIETLSVLRLIAATEGPLKVQTLPPHLLYPLLSSDSTPHIRAHPFPSLMAASDGPPNVETPPPPPPTSRILLHLLHLLLLLLPPPAPHQDET